MENFIGTLNINGNVSIQDSSSAEETLKDLLDNTATFKDLLAILHERAGKNSELVKAKRCPGSEQLRSGHELIARIAVGEATCEVYENGYAVFDNGDRKTVVWVPDCPKAARYYYPATYDEKCKEERRLRGEDPEDDPDCRIIEGTEPGEDRLDEEQLAEMTWYLAVVIAGENRIEQNLEHPISSGSRSDRYNDDLDSTGRYSWSCGARFQNPEDAVLYREEQAERCADLTEKQREVYRYYYEEEYTQEEIAGMLGISHQAVCDRLESVRKKIAEYYERNR